MFAIAETASFPEMPPKVERKEVFERDESFETNIIYDNCRDRSFDDGDGAKTG